MSLRPRSSRSAISARLSSLGVHDGVRGQNGAMVAEFGAHGPVQIDLVAEQLLLRGVHAHHSDGVRRAKLTGVQSLGWFGQQALKT